MRELALLKNSIIITLDSCSFIETFVVTPKQIFMGVVPDLAVITMSTLDNFSDIYTKQ